MSDLSEGSGGGSTRGPGGPAEPSQPRVRPTEELRRLEGGTFWGWLKKTARLWGFLAFIAIILIIFRRVILPFILAGLTAYLLAPMLRFLCQLRIGRLRCPRFAWVILVYAVLLGLQVLFITSFVPRVAKDFKRVVQESPALVETARQRWLPAFAAWLRESFGTDASEPRAAPPARRPSPPPAPKLRLSPVPGGGLELDAGELNVEVVQRGDGRWLIRTPRAPVPGRSPEQRLTDAINGYVNEFAQSSEAGLTRIMQLGQALLLGLLGTITTFILVLMISAFLLLDPERIIGALRNLVPESSYRDFDNVIALIDKGLSGAIRGQLLICLINGLLTWAGLWIIGVKYSLLLAVLAGTMSLIPIFGSILSSIPIVIVALVSGGAGLDLFKGLMMLAWIVGIHLLEANLLNPKIIGSAARIHPVVVIFAVVAGEGTYGPIGALLGVPLVSAVQAVFIYLRQKARGESSDPARTR